MRRVLWIVSLVTLVVLALGIVGQAFVVAFDVNYTPTGDIANPTPPAITATALSAGGLIGMPLTGLTLILGLLATAQDKRPGWLLAIIGATLLACVGLFAMIWILLSVRSPILFQAPLIVIPLITALYCRLPAPPVNATPQL